MSLSQKIIGALLVLILIGGGTIAGWTWWQGYEKEQARKHLEEMIVRERAEQDALYQRISEISQERAQSNAALVESVPLSAEAVAELEAVNNALVTKLTTLRDVVVEETVSLSGDIYQATQEACETLGREVDRIACIDNILYRQATTGTNVRACSFIVDEHLKHICVGSLRTQEALRTKNVRACFEVDQYVRFRCYSAVESEVFAVQGGEVCTTYPSEDQKDCKDRYKQWEIRQKEWRGVFADDRQIAIDAIDSRSIAACPIRHADNTGMHSWCRLHILMLSTDETVSRADRVALCSLLSDEPVRIATEIFSLEVVEMSERARCLELLVSGDSPVSRQSQ